MPGSRLTNEQPIIASSRLGDGAIPPSRPSAADTVAPLIRQMLGDPVPVRFEFWDGTVLGPSPVGYGGPGVVHIRSADAVRQILWAPGELGVARAFVNGDIEIEGDIFTLLRALHRAAPQDLRKRGWQAVPVAIDAARKLGVLGLPPAPPAEEVRPKGTLHSPARDAQAVSHHYDAGNDFYRLFLGPSMTYSCARFDHDSVDLTQAQEAKHESVCRKLGLHRMSGASLLDVGCGWGSMALHAAAHHDVRVVGITLSTEQAEYARQRAAEAGLSDRVEIRLEDYRRLGGERFDAISSIGMFEHVGAARMASYFETLRDLLVPTGRLLNHAISSPGGSKLGRRSFVGRYVFPDSELIDVGQVVLAMERAGFEVRDVESLREHYAKTLRAWVANLQAGWDQAVANVGEHRARIWYLYMAASANGFDDGGLAIHQVLGVLPTEDGLSGMPPVRVERA